MTIKESLGNQILICSEYILETFTLGLISPRKCGTGPNLDHSVNVVHERVRQELRRLLHN